MSNDPTSRININFSKKQAAAIHICFGLYVILVFTGTTVLGRLQTDVNGKIIDSWDAPGTGAPRYATTYRIQGTNGEKFTYVAGATDSSLPRSMPVGTMIEKKRWHLSYKKNGRTVNDFPVIFYSATFTVGLCFLLAGLRRLFSKEK